MQPTTGFSQHTRLPTRTMLRLLQVVIGATVIGCGARLAPVPPPRVAPELQHAMSDTAGGKRAYLPQEVHEPAALREGTRAPFVGKDAEVVLRFVVDTTGIAIPETIEWTSGTDTTLARWAAARLQEWRFVPARSAAGRRVPQITELTLIKVGNTTLTLLSTELR